MGHTAATNGYNLSVLAATMILLLCTATVDGNVVSPFCRTATTHKKDQGVCTGLVKGAKTWDEAMTNGINAVIEIAKAQKGKAVDSVEAKLPKGLRPATKESITKGCKDAFDMYVSYLEDCIGWVKNDPDSSLETILSGNTFYNCKDGFDEFQIQNPDVYRFYDMTTYFADILLSIYQTKPADHQ
ncbi:glutamine synthetase [Striga asiatica]|uniref:Glutamine synthetase n=1 Tax=Striga asiatica TaxID=4170 RepID=A0A5A7QXL3_STRAF|nr:glutamine synthetase [Striga asiatica]